MLPGDISSRTVAGGSGARSLRVPQHGVIVVDSFRKVVGNAVVFSVPPDSPCPCGRNDPAAKCCLTEAGFRKVPAATTPPGPTTGASLTSCYASRLADCSSRISREHYVSESLLRHLNRNNGLTVGGLRWIDGESKALPPSALTSNILCNRHNSALSPLDAIAVRLFEAFDQAGAAGSGQKLLFLFSGHDIERWLLKILCGLASSNNLPTDIDGDVDLSIPKYWLDILFGHEEFSNEQGLYMCKSPGHRFSGPHGLTIQTIVGKNRLTGMGLCVCGYELILSMSGFPSRFFDGRAVAYRPLELYATGRDFEKSVMLIWNGGADLGTVSLTIGET